MPKKSKFEILMVLDRSGSTRDLTGDYVGTYNSFIEEQQEALVDSKVRVTTVTFDDKIEVVGDRIKPSKVPEIDAETIKPRGMTALIDAACTAINSVKGDRPAICFIQTDGGENASTEYTTEDLKEAS